MRTALSIKYVICVPEKDGGKQSPEKKMESSVPEASEKVDEGNNIGEFYLHFKNVGSTHLQPSSIQHKVSEFQTCDVIDRGAFVKRVSEIEDKDLSDEVLQASVSHLILRRFLRIGDSGLHNILLVDKSSSLYESTKQTVVGVDLEEFNSKAGDSSLNYKMLQSLLDKHGCNSDAILAEFINTDNLTVDDIAKTWKK